MSDTDRLDAGLQHIAECYDLAGMSVAVVCDRKVRYLRGFGWADIRRNVETTASTLYRVASISKSVTATAVMVLYDLGLLDLDRDIGDCLGYAVRNPRYPDIPITVRMLMSHTSSLVDGPSYDDFLGDTYHSEPGPSLADLFAEAHGLFLECPPGSRFEYSNLNYGILGSLVEAATNMRFDLFCRKHMFRPLNMYATFNIQDVDDINAVAVLYRKVHGTWTPQMDEFRGVMPPARDLSRCRPGANALVFSPHGGLRASAEALAIFMLMHMNDGAWKDVRILKPETARLMRHPQCGCGTDGEWGLGFRLPVQCLGGEVLFRGGPVAGHSGEAYGLLSGMYFDASSGKGVVFITNGCGAGISQRRPSGFHAVEEELLRSVDDFLAGS